MMISVNSKLPAIKSSLRSEFVLTKYQGGGHAVARLHKMAGELVWLTPKWQRMPAVTHWMPLPSTEQCMVPNTRVSVAQLLSELAEGWNLKEIAEDMSINRRDIKKALLDLAARL